MLNTSELLYELFQNIHLAQFLNIAPIGRLLLLDQENKALECDFNFGVKERLKFGLVINFFP